MPAGFPVAEFSYADLDADLIRQLEAAARTRPGKRVEAVEIDGQRYWIKRPEQLKPRLRLQKGNPHRAFARECAAFPILRRAGLPVPQLLAEGPGFIAIADAGTSLARMLRQPAPRAERYAAFAAAGNALARFHLAGMAHGRPSIRDFCWNGSAITVLDFERFDPVANTPARLRNDLMILVYSTILAAGPRAPELGALVSTYRQSAPGSIWRAAHRIARRMRWAGGLLRPFLRFDGRHGEWGAVPVTLDYFASAPAVLPATPLAPL